MLMVAGFGDDSSMFQPLFDTPLARAFKLLPINLPGFGAPPLPVPATLDALAGWLAVAIADTGATLLMGHSIASVIASLAAHKSVGQIETIISLEGNLTAKDAYFSATAARYDSADDFLAGFLPKLDQKATDNPILARYAHVVRRADAQALWALGCDVAKFSHIAHPGDLLRDCARAIYCYNPDNCADVSIAWLNSQPIDRILLEGASHWPSLDVPDQLSDKLLELFARG